jgi:hypothetical protein
MSTVRVIEPVIVTDPASGALVTLKKGDAYEHTDPLVREYGWAFGSDVEDASATPGQRRNR